MKRTAMLLLPMLALGLLLMWGSALTSAAEEEDQPKRPGITKVDPDTEIKDIKSDAFKLGEVTIEDDVLKLEVSYSGGTKEHDFTLYWNGIVARSYPGKTTLVLKHDGNGDMAEAWITKTLAFDLNGINKPMIITVMNDHDDKATVQYGER